ncbi:hypothetical protein IKE83_00505, partial [Candidatus Saccharibacteria bacterium]|nr:hypothetical protein [Candidatus Saccharibacteria bacterium]
GALPGLACTAFTGFVVYEALRYKAGLWERRAELAEGDEHSKAIGKAKTRRVWSKIVAVITVIALILHLVGAIVGVGFFSLIKREKAEVETQTEEVKEEPAEEEPATEEPVKIDWVFRHDDVLADNFDEDGNELTGDALKAAKVNDYDFGRNPMQEILDEKVRSGELSYKDILKCDSELELLKMLTAEEVMGKLFEEFDDGEPAKLAAMSFYHYATLPSQFNGTYFTNWTKDKDQAMILINDQAAKWAEDPEAYSEALEKFKSVLEFANEVKLEYHANGIDDQMYMFGVTPGERPEVIVMESKDHGGFFITFKYVIKETLVIEVSYRIDCDFQPCNVGPELNVTVKKNPNKPAPSKPTPAPKPEPKKEDPKPETGTTSGGKIPASTSGTTSGGRSSSSGSISGGRSSGSSSGGTWNPPITHPKDPTKGTDVGKNDNPGPGPDTNNGVGAAWSSKEESTDSAHETYREYKEDIQELKEINETQRTGGDSNTPSTPTPANTTVDSNAEKGTGNGGIDTPTPTKSEAKTVDNTPVTASDGDGAWIPGDNISSGADISTFNASTNGRDTSEAPAKADSDATGYNPSSYGGLDFGGNG